MYTTMCQAASQWEAAAGRRSAVSVLYPRRGAPRRVGGAAGWEGGSRRRAYIELNKIFREILKRN